MSDEDLQRKFFANCEPVIGKSRASSLLEAVWRFERAGAMTDLLRWL